MSKKKWLFVILVVAFFVYLGISKVNPAWGWSIDNVLGGAVGKAKADVEATSIWQQYDVYFALATGCIITGIIMWKGRPVYDRVRGFARVSARGESVVSTPQPIMHQTPQGATTRPQTQKVEIEIKQPPPTTVTEPKVEKPKTEEAST